MMNSFGEMNYTLQVLKNPNNNKSEIKRHLNSLHDVCCLIYNNPNVYAGEKDSLKIAEWEFIKYALWDSKDSSCIKWFRQWNNDINFDYL